MLVSSATELWSTLESIKAPNSVKAYGSDFLGRLILDVITNCDEISTHSSSVSWNMKSLGKRLIYHSLSANDIDEVLNVL